MHEVADRLPVQVGHAAALARCGFIEVRCAERTSGVTLFGTVYRFLRILGYLSPMVESRRASRLHVLKTATIKFVGGGSISCLVRNLSSTGAALEVSNQAGIPERFILVMPGDGLHMLCRTVWRHEHRIGVTFV
jgi:PilZ domain